MGTIATTTMMAGVIAVAIMAIHTIEGAIAATTANTNIVDTDTAAINRPWAISP